MKAKIAKLFMNGRSQAVRLPKEFRFRDTDEVLIYQSGNKLCIEPINHSWEPILQAIDQFPDEFEFEKAPIDNDYKDLF